jgi:uncharacterized membrane protein YdbT with pleckstrin-like domain
MPAMENNTSSEEILWTGRSSQVLNAWTYLLSLVLAVAGLVLMFLLAKKLSPGMLRSASLFMVGGLLAVIALLALRVWARVRFRTFQITTERVHVITGIFSRRIDDLELYRVKDITVLEPLGLRMLGRASIVLNTSDRSTPTVVIQAVPEAEKLRDLIRTHVEACRQRKGVHEVDYDRLDSTPPK